MPTTVPIAPHPPAVRPRVRARRGQATDPHSIAERVGALNILKNTVELIIQNNDKVNLLFSRLANFCSCCHSMTVAQRENS